MERKAIVLFTLLLSGTSAFAGYGAGRFAHNRGGDMTAPRIAVPGDAEMRNSTRSQPARLLRVADSSVEFETALWRIVKQSRNAADYEAYLEVFPHGKFAEQARETLARLRAGPSGARPGGERRIQPAPVEMIDKIEETYTVRVTANLRQGPSIEAPIVGRAEKGQQLFVLGRTVGRNWYKVSIATGGIAYIAGNLIEKSRAGADAPPTTTTPRKSELPARDPAAEPQRGEATASVPRADGPSASLQGQGAGRQSPPQRKSVAEIKAHWNRQIDLVKESGPHGDCLLHVGDPFFDPPEFDICEDRNEKIKSLRLQMERELTERQ